MQKTFGWLLYCRCEKMRAWIMIMLVNTYFRSYKNVIFWNFFLSIVSLFLPSYSYFYSNSILIDFISSWLVVNLYFFKYATIFFLFENISWTSKKIFKSLGLWQLSPSWFCSKYFHRLISHDDGDLSLCWVQKSSWKNLVFSKLHMKTNYKTQKVRNIWFCL